MHRLWIASALAAASLAGCAPATPDADTSAWDHLPPSPPMTLTLSAPIAATIGGTATFTVTGAMPGETVRVFQGSALGDGACPQRIGGLCVDLISAGVAYDGVADATGTAIITPTVPASATLDETTYFQAFIRRGLRGADTVASNIEAVRASDGSARLRVVHGSPDAPNVDIYADGGLLVSDLAYQESTGYVAVPPGTYAVDIRAAGALPSSPPAYSIPALTLDGNVDYTAIAAGYLGSAMPDDQFRVLALVDDWGSPARGSYRARIVHASPDAPTVDIDVGNDGSSEIAALPRFADTGADGVPLPSDTTLAVGVAGGALSFTVPGLPEATDVLVIANGNLGAERANEDDAFGLLAIIDDGDPVFLRQDPKVYALHASADAPTVDVKVGSATIVDDLSFRDLAGPVSVPPGSYDLDIYDDTGTTFVTSWPTPMLEAGETYLAVATGFLTSTPGFTILPLVDDLPIDATMSTVSVVHASPDAPTVTAGALLPAYTALTPALSYLDPAADVTVAPGTYDLAVGTAAGDAALFTFPGISLLAGDRLFAIANGSLIGGSFGVTLVDTTTTPWTAATLTP
ncbi:MAG: DUF4397 domain-containing protein [Alphaproteobacteria bacterium]|nr:DUF4397 domain-containing protein [Alphaproteobacteria bacterium]